MRKPLAHAGAGRGHATSVGPDVVKMEQILFNTLKAFRTALVKRDVEQAADLEQRSTQLLDKLRLKRRKVG